MDDFSGLEYDQDSVSEEDIVSKTNNLLSQFNLPTQVTRAEDITASLFVVLYESLFSDRLPGILRQPVTKEDEIHNCQLVIDVLSADVIKDNLSHIRGVDIVGGKPQSINNLIDIFSFLYEYVIKQIESDVATDTEDDARSMDRGDLGEASESFEPVPVLDSLDVEGDDYRSESESAQSHNGGSNGQNRNIAQAAKVESRGIPRAANNGMKGNSKVPVAVARVKTRATPAPPSPIRHNASSSINMMGHGTLDSTGELIQEGERLARQQGSRRGSPAKSAWPVQDPDEQPGRFDFIGIRPVSSNGPSIARPVPTTALPSSWGDPTATSSSFTSAPRLDAFLEPAIPVASSAVVSGVSLTSSVPVSHHRPVTESIDSAPNLSATAPMPRTSAESRQKPDRLRSTVASVPYHSRMTPEKPYQHRESPAKGLSSSYQDLNSMVQQTAAMSRVAVDTSPMRMRHDRATLLDITDLSHERHQLPQSEAYELARELNRAGQPHPYSLGDSDQIPLTNKDRAYTHDSKDVMVHARENIPPRTYTIPPNTNYRGVSPINAVKAANKQQPMHMKDPLRIRPVPPELQQGRGVGHLEPRLVDIMDELHGHGNEDVMAEARRRRAAGKARQAAMSSKLQEMGKPTLANAQRRLETEDRAYNRKHDYLKKLYEEEFDDVVEEVKNLVGQDHQLMKDMEEEYRKLMLIANKTPKKSKPVTKPKAKGYLLPKFQKSKPQRVSRRQKGDCEEESVKVRERPLAVGQDEELMPILMEQFPHLHLSDHTWHELWRKGISQIENLTRAYEENKRRKSQAQVQLEEAAQKHEVLAAIVKKQMEHNQRMHQIKEQKRQQVATKNKLQEKRSQSARSRRYYNEYQVRARSKMLKRRTKEELIFKNLFKDGLAIQKERIQDVQKYAKEQRSKQARKRQDEIESMENYYRDQFEMLVGKLVKDREDMVSREKSHQKVLSQMKRGLRRKMEKEIGDIQSEMFRDEDDAYFRQLEADRLRQELHMAKYQTRV